MDGFFLVNYSICDAVIKELYLDYVSGHLDGLSQFFVPIIDTDVADKD